jgi:hypothetical protein
MVERAEVLLAISRALEPLDHVHALWEAGAASWGRVDRWSDIDVNVDAEDGREPDVFRAVEAALESLSRIEVRYPIPFPASHAYAQTFYRLADASPFLIVDLAVFKHSAGDKFLQSEIHGPPVFLFDKKDVKAAEPLDREAHLSRIMARIDRLRLRYEIFGGFVEKEIRRKNWIEALANYQRITLDTLLEVLRVRSYPAHFDFGVRYVHYELPPAATRRFARLSFVRDEEDLKRKSRAADRWLRSELAAVGRAGVARALGIQEQDLDAPRAPHSAA